MKFKKYSSIENSYRGKEIEKIQKHPETQKTEWVVTEKIHGTNFSFLCDGEEVKVAKRSSILPEEKLSKFYDADIMLEKYKDNILALFAILKRMLPELKEIQVYGEHFGGIYNDKTEKGYTKIQKEVHYIPFTDFIVFDILASLDYIDFFLSWDNVKKLCSEVKLKTVPELFRGTFEECLKYPNEFITKIPKMYGLDPIEGNICEGVVIKPIADLKFNDESRLILKNKNDKFKEKGKVKKPRGVNTINLTLEDEKWVDEISRYFEISRIQNVLSKGDVKLDWKQFGKLVGLFFKDALEDFIKDNEEFTKLDKGSKKLIQRYAQSRAKDFIREFMKSIFKIE